MPTKVSIIVPVYNTEAYLRKCLESLVKQSLDGVEVLAVDNNSTDGSAKIIREYEKKYPDVVRLLECKTTGVSAARNIGIRAARGEYLAFCDSDDYVEPRMCEVLYDCAKKNNADLVVCDYYLDKQDDGVQPVSPGLENRNKDMAKNYLCSITVAPWNKLVKRSLVADNKLFFREGIIYEDLAVVPAYILYAKKCSYVAEPLYHYVCRDGSIINSSRKPNEDIFAALDTLYGLFEKNGAVEKYKEEIEYVYIRHLLHNAAARYLLHESVRVKNLRRIKEIMRSRFPRWRKNVYYAADSAKYKFFCEMICRGTYGVLLGGSKIKKQILRRK